MMGDSLPSTLFGVPRGLDPDELNDLEDFLREAWKAQYGQPPSTLSADLDRLRDVFKTGASGKRLREVVGGLGRLPRRPSSASEKVFIVIDERRGLVTPEGRAVLEQLTLMREDREHVFSREALLRATSVVAQAYGEWQRDWLARQLGRTSLRPGTYGIVLLLLLNGSTRRENALRLPASAEQERELARAVIPVVDAFATRLGGQEMSEREAQRLRSNWRLTEARKHLFEHVRADESDGDAFIWVDDEEQAITLLAERLAGRRDLDLSTLQAALAAAAETYAATRPKLAAWGIAHDRANHTRHVLSRLEDHFVRERSEL